MKMMLLSLFIRQKPKASKVPIDLAQWMHSLSQEFFWSMIMSPLAAASWTIIHCLIRSKCTLQPWWQNFEDKKVAVSQEVLYLENFWALAKKVFTNTYIMQIFNKMNCLWHITSWDTLYPPLTICCCHFFVSVFSNFKACAYAAKIWNSNWLCNTMYQHPT